MRFLRALITSWNPNTYHEVRERSLLTVFLYALAAAALSVIVFGLLIIPAIVQADAAADALSKTTNITLGATFEQGQPTYLVRNPDILFAAEGGDGVVVVSREGVSVKRFIWFGREQFRWSEVRSLTSVPATDLLLSFTVFAAPSIIVWGSLLVLAHAIVWSLLYSLVAYFILHSREYSVRYPDLWRVSVTATMPSMALFAITPILRIGLPLGVIAGFIGVLWLSLTVLGTALFIEKKTARAARKSR